jgi:hypothetical protein
MTTSLTTRVSTDATYAPAVKGSPISSAEIDNNFISLATNKIETSVMDTAATANKLVLRDGSGNINTVGISASGAIAANSGSITSSQTTFNLLTATVTTLNIGSAATTIQSGYTGTATSTNNISTGAVASGSTKTLNIGTSGVSGSTTTITIGSSVTGSTNTTAIYGSLGIGTAADTPNGSVRAVGTITSNYSDERLKTNIQVIPNALEKVCSLRGVTYTANTLAESFGYTNKEIQVGVLSQDLEKVLPEVVKPAPFDRIFIEGIEISKSGQEYKTVHYERIVPLLIEAIKELNSQVKELKGVK